MELFFDIYKKYPIFTKLFILTGALFLIRKYFNGPKCIVEHNNIKDKIIIITGATTGIGFETAKELLKKGAIVIFACRDEKRTLYKIENYIDKNYLKNSHFLKVDLSNIESIKNFANNFKKKFDNFDILINNAGAMNDSFERTADGFESSIGVNYLGGMFITLLLIKDINQNGRIINVSSSLLSNYKFNVEDLLEDISFNKTQKNYNFVKQYSLSKQCQYIFSKFLNSNEFKIFNKTKNFKSVILHPGVIFTDAQTKFKSFYIYFFGILFFPFWYLCCKSLHYGCQTTMHTVLEDYEKLKENGYYADCAVQKLPDHIVDENYYKYILFYSNELVSNYVLVNNLPEEIKSNLNLMRRTSGKNN